MQIHRNAALILSALLQFSFGQVNSARWSMVLIPDPQTYVKFDANKHILDGMIKWIIQTKDSLNTKLVICVGDLVEQNAIKKPDNRNGDQTGDEQWAAAKAAWSQLDDVLPYILAMGNHDYGIKNIENRNTQFNTFFTPEVNSLIDPARGGLLKNMGLNAFGVPSMENAFYEFVSPVGRKYFILSLEFAPRQAVVDWADSLANHGDYQNHTGILVTHSYLSPHEKKNKRITSLDYPVEKDANMGEDLWQKLVKPHGLFEMVFCGHEGTSNAHAGQVGFRVDENDEGKTVHQMLFNAQREGGGWHGNGGNGWLRVLEFTNHDNNVDVITYSPYLKKFREGKIDAFSMRLSPFTPPVTTIGSIITSQKAFSYSQASNGIYFQFKRPAKAVMIHDLLGKAVFKSYPNQTRMKWDATGLLGLFRITTYEGNASVNKEVIFIHP